MAKKPKSDQGSANGGEPVPAPHKLTYKQRRFIEEYIKNNGNGSAAAREAGYSVHTCAEIAVENLRKPQIIAALAQERDRQKNAVGFSREEALSMLVAMARGRHADFVQVLAKPSDQESYADLGDKEYALKKVTESYKNGNSIELYDRESIINNLWEKLGLGQTNDRSDWKDEFRKVFGLFKKASGE